MFQAVFGSIMTVLIALEFKDEQRRYKRAVHSAVFCEVRVNDAMGTVRATRVVSAVACGRIINELTARSQMLGGIVWGMGQALHEGTLLDQALGRFMTVDLANYHVPVNADIHALEVIFVLEHDPIVSRLGARASARSAGWASWRRSPMRSGTPPDAGSARCR